MVFRHVQPTVWLQASRRNGGIVVTGPVTKPTGMSMVGDRIEGTTLTELGKDVPTMSHLLKDLVMTIYRVA